MTKLSIAAVTREAFAFTWQKRSRFWFLAWPGIVVFSIEPFVKSWLLARSLNPYSPDLVLPSFSTLLSLDAWMNNLIHIGSWIIIFLVVVMFSIAWHREYLIPNAVSTVSSSYIWRSRQWKFFRIYLELFFLYLIAVPVILFSMTMISPIIDQILGSNLVFGAVGLFVYGGVWVVCGWFYTRIALAFPAIAVDIVATSQGAWHFSRGNGWRLFSVLAIVAFIYGAALWLLSLAGEALPTGHENALTLMLALPIAVGYATLELIGIAIGVSALSIAYRKLAEAGSSIEEPAAG